jgi:DnaK suppressor protein
MNQKQKEALKAQLLETRKEILSRLQAKLQTDDQIGQHWSDPRDVEDWASITLTEELFRLLSRNEVQELQQIDEALRRMKEGTYGICRRCGNPIPYARLEMIPWTDLCHMCSRELEQHTFSETP